jgi:hypothetical protein
LTHATLLLIVSKSLEKHQSTWVGSELAVRWFVAGIAILICLFVADLTYRHIERPSHAYAKRNT